MGMAGLRTVAWWTTGILGVVLGGTVLVRADIAARREHFRGEAQALHRLLSERLARHEAIAATLALNLPRPPGDAAPATQRLDDARLPAGLPTLRAAWVIGSGPAAAAVADTPVPPALAQLPPASATGPTWSTMPVPGAPAMEWWLLRQPNHALGLCIDLLRLRDDPQWPRGLSPQVRVVLERSGRAPVVLQPGPSDAEQPWGWTAGFQHDADVSSAVAGMRVRLNLATGPAEWPWALLVAMAAMWSALVVLA